MNTQLTGHHIEITQETREYTEKKLTRLKPFQGLITNLHLTFKEDNKNKIVEAQISLTGKVIHVEATAESMHEAIDDLMDKIVRQVNKHKEKIKDHRSSPIVNDVD